MDYLEYYCSGCITQRSYSAFQNHSSPALQSSMENNFRHANPRVLARPSFFEIGQYS